MKSIFGVSNTTICCLLVKIILLGIPLAAMIYSYIHYPEVAIGISVFLVLIYLSIKRTDSKEESSKPDLSEEKSLQTSLHEEILSLSGLDLPDFRIIGHRGQQTQQLGPEFTTIGFCDYQTARENIKEQVEVLCVKDSEHWEKRTERESGDVVFQFYRSLDEYNMSSLSFIFCYRDYNLTIVHSYM